MNTRPALMACAAVSAWVAAWFAFSFVRATNLANPAAGHMHRLTVTFQDPDHFSREWTWRENGTVHTEVFQFTRKS